MMKILKLTTLVFGLFLFSGYALGQKWSIGLKMGGNLSVMNEKITGSLPSSIAFPYTFNDYQYLPNFQVGFVGKMELTDQLGLIVEPGFIQKGAKDKALDTRLRFGYLSLPVLIYYCPMSKINLEIGPELSYRLFYAINGSHVDSPFSKWDFSAIIGASYDLTEKLNFGARYSHGLSGMSESIVFNNESNEGTSVFDDVDFNIRNRYFEFFVRYYLFKN